MSLIFWRKTRDVAPQNTKTVEIAEETPLPVRLYPGEDDTIAVLSIIPGTGATNLGKAVDAVAGARDTGVVPLVIRDDALGALTPIEGDYVGLRVDANGALWTHDDALDAALSGSELQVDVVAALPAGTNAIGKLAANSGVDIGDVDVLTINGVAPSFDQADGAGVTGAMLAQLVVRDSSTQRVVISANKHGQAADTGLSTIAVLETVFNGTSFDSVRNNAVGTLLASAARTATVSSADQTNFNARGVRVRINVSSVTDTPSITVAVEEKDSISGNYVAILTSAAITTTGQKTTLVVYPGIAASANVKADDPLPRTWRVTVTHGDADSITYSVDYALIL